MKIVFASDLGFRGVDERLSKEYIETVLFDARESMKSADFISVYRQEVSTAASIVPTVYVQLLDLPVNGGLRT